MFVRIMYVTGDPRKIDDAITALTKQGTEMLREQPGYRGVAVLADRELGKLAVGSYWENEQAARQSDEALRERRIQLVAPFAASVSVELFEVAAIHQVRQPGATAAARLVRMEFEPAVIDQLNDSIQAVFGKLDSVPGFCRASAFADRERGQAIVVLTFSDRDALAASRSPGAALRAEVTRQTGQVVATRSLEEFDIVLFEAPSP